MAESMEADMNFCILRLEKLKTLDEVERSAKHTFREIRTKNADPSRTHKNKTWGAQTSAEVRAAIEAKLPAKRRKDAVSCIEYLITASPEFFKTAPVKAQNAYFDGAVKWLEAKHGKENVVCVNMQLDETSPHLVAYVVPLTKDGRLSAKEIVGNQKAMKDMQTHFAEVVGKPVGLQRGIEDSGAVHTTVRQFYQAIEKNPALAPPKPSAPMPKPTVVDRLSGRAKEMEEDREKVERERAKEEAKRAALVEQARNVALVSARARQEQAKALEVIRNRAAQMELDREAAEREKREAKAKAERLERENRQLKRQAEQREQEFAKERRSLLTMIDDLKQQLQSAWTRLKRLAAWIVLLEDQLYPPKEDSRQSNEIRTKL
jgi:Plasmid recombination enzyme